MANFIDFVAACAQDPKLGKEFVTSITGKSAKELLDWFAAKGYTLTESDCEKLAANSNEIGDIKQTALRETY